MNLKNLFFAFCLLFLFNHHSFSQDGKEILANHKKGGHSIGGIVVPLFWADYQESTFNIRYGYFFSDRNEVGIDLLLRGWSQYPSGRSYFESQDLLTSFYYRRYLGKKRFGVFVEGGYKFVTKRHTKFSRVENTSRINFEDGYDVNIYQHILYGTAGLYYHGLAKGRLGVEFGLGLGPSYYPANSFNFYSNWTIVVDFQLRIKYFFKHKK